MDESSSPTQNPLDTSPSAISGSAVNPSPLPQQNQKNANNFIVILLLIFVWPIGVIVMWISTPWKMIIKIILTLLPFILVMIGLSFGTLSSLLMYKEQSEYIGFGGSPTTADNQAEKLVYLENLPNNYIKVTSPKYKFTFEYPTTLMVTTPSNKPQAGMPWGFTFYLRDAITSKTESRYAPSISVHVWDQSSTTKGVSRWIEEGKKLPPPPQEVISRFKGYTVVRDYLYQNTLNKNEEAYIITDETSKIAYNIKFMTQFTSDDESPRTLDSSPERIAKAQPLYKEIFSSFEILP